MLSNMNKIHTTKSTSHVVSFNFDDSSENEWKINFPIPEHFIVVWLLCWNYLFQSFALTELETLWMFIKKLMQININSIWKYKISKRNGMKHNQRHLQFEYETSFLSHSHTMFWQQPSTYMYCSSHGLRLCVCIYLHAMSNRCYSV